MKNNRIRFKTGPAAAFVIVAVLALATVFGNGCSEMVSEYLELETKEQHVWDGDGMEKPEQTEASEETNASKETENKKSGDSDNHFGDDGYYELPEWTVVDDIGFDVKKIDIPEYEGKPTAVINKNKPFFTEDEITDEYFIEISKQDAYGRCGANWMCADEVHIQEGERGRISDIHPSGWHSGGFYERSHLLMWKLSGCNNKKNLISGTDTFNQEAMLEYEERVTDYLWHNVNNHVMYRVSPLFKGKELVARGVLMECWSVEDDGEGLSFCVFVYNVEPGYEINYANGDYQKTK